jgi:hypothetical protein
LFLAATSIGGFMQAMTGIGYGMILMGLGTLVFPYVQILSTIKILALLFILPVLINYREKIQWNILLLPLLFTIPGNAIALKMLQSLDDGILTILLGGILGLTGIYFLLVKKTVSIKPNLVSGGLAGILVGILSGVSSISGPALALYYLNIDELANDKDAYYATTLTTFQIVGLYQVSLLLFRGVFPAESWSLIIWGLLPTSVGIFFGGKLFAKVHMKLVKTGIYSFMVLMGFFLIITNIL